MTLGLLSEAQRLRNHQVRKALTQVVAFQRDADPSAYDLFHTILTVSLTLPQELKGAYVMAIAELFQDEEDPRSPEWLKFRDKLFTLLEKGQGLLHAGDRLLQGFQIQPATVRQLALFPQSNIPTQPVIDDGGVRIDPETGEVIDGEEGPTHG